MSNEGVLRGLSLAMTIQNATGNWPRPNENATSSPMIIEEDLHQPLKEDAASLTDYFTADFSGDFEIGVTANCFGLLSHEQRLFGGRLVSQIQPYFEIRRSSDSYSYRFGFTTGQGTDPPIEIKSDRQSYPVILNRWMHYKLVYKNESLIATILKDNGSVYFTGTVGNHPHGYAGTYSMFGGSLYEPLFIASSCVIDFSNTYIQTGDTLVWGRKAGS